MAKCVACGAEITFAVNEATGKKVPLVMFPSKEIVAGNEAYCYVIIEGRENCRKATPEEVSDYVTGDYAHYDQLPPCLGVSHYRNCTNPNRFTKKVTK